MSLPWFQDRFPLYLAPMAGVTDTIFRQLAKEYGADVVVTEFVSAEGIFRKNERTLEYLEFVDAERPVGVQLFWRRSRASWRSGTNGDRLETARLHRSEFWVSGEQNRGEERRLVAVARLSAARARGAECGAWRFAPFPVTAKMRIGWDDQSINAVTTARILEDAGVAAIAVHGRTKEQGYTGTANWEVIAQVAAAVRVPVIGNGDLAGAVDVERALQSGVRGVMIGRAAMSSPWIFREIKHYLATGAMLSAPPLDQQWAHMLRHCRWKVAAMGRELHAMQCMRTRLMAYSRGMPEAKRLRDRFRARCVDRGTRRDRGGSSRARCARGDCRVIEKQDDQRTRNQSPHGQRKARQGDGARELPSSLRCLPGRVGRKGRCAWR